MSADQYIDGEDTDLFEEDDDDFDEEGDETLNDLIKDPNSKKR